MEADQLNIGPVIVKKEEGENHGNWKTSLFETVDSSSVLKIDSKVQKKVIRIEGETEDQYYKRRLEGCFNFINTEKADEEIVSKYVPESILYPRESYLIIDGEDGFPVVAKVQEKVEGSLLKDTDFGKLSPQNEADLDAIVDASIKCYLETGRVLDITGWSGKGEGRYKWLWQSMTKPLKESSNIFLNKEGKIVIVDLKSSFPGDSLTRKVGRFIHFSGLVAYRLGQEIKKRKKSSL